MGLESAGAAECVRSANRGLTGIRGRLRRRDKGESMGYKFRNLWLDEEGQDVAEYSVMLAVILVIVVGTVRLIGSNASNVFSQVGSSIQ